MATIEDLIPHIYHEKQQPGEMLCAQHALNSLLQGSYFSAPDLSEIARQLDEDERRALDDGERAITSTNMDDTGFFSVQVLQKALTDSFDLSLVPWGAEELRPYHDHPHTQIAFILNHAEHWYTLRRFGSVSSDPENENDPAGGHWFNLNSFNNAPERISKLYLGMFLQQAQQEGYSMFAVIQRDRDAKLALPRVEVDFHLASIPEDTAGNFSYSNAYSSTQRSSTKPPLEGFEDEDMELQAALQASLAGGDYIPYRFDSGSSRSSRPQQAPNQQTFGIPIHRNYEAIDSDDDADVDMRAPAEPPSAPEVDPIAASMARQRAVMERMRRAQEYALQEQYEDEVARVNTRARLQQTRGRGAEDEDEMLRRAMAESEALAQAEGSASGPNSGQTSGREEAAPAPQVVPAWPQHRVYDDEDEELQAALRASLETVPEGFRASTPPPVAPLPPARQSTLPTQAHPSPPPLQRQASSDIETESEAETADAPEPEQFSMEEIRRRRLARFGG